MAANNGYYLTARKLYSDPLYDEMQALVKKKKPIVGYYRFQALQDLFRRANYTQSHVVIGNKTIAIERGQVFISAEKLANEWGWSHHRVDNFLRYLEQERDTIRKEQGKHFCVITICKYDEYQDPKHYEGKKKEPEGKVSGNSRESGGNHQNESNEVNEIIEPTPAKADDEIDDPRVAKRKKLEADVDEFIEFWNELSPVPENPKSIKLRGIVKGGISRCGDELWDAAENYWFCVNSPLHNDYEPRLLSGWFKEEFHRKFLPGFNPRVNYRKKK